MPLRRVTPTDHQHRVRVGLPKQLVERIPTGDGCGHQTLGSGRAESRGFHVQLVLRGFDGGLHGIKVRRVLRTLGVLTVVNNSHERDRGM